MNQEFVIQSDQNDEYRLRITSEHIGMLSEPLSNSTSLVKTTFFFKTFSIPEKVVALQRCLKMKLKNTKTSVRNISRR